MAKRKFIRSLAAEKEEEKKVAKEQKKDNGQGQGQLVAAISAAVEKGIGSGLKVFVDEQQKTNQAVLKTLEKISASQEELVSAIHDRALEDLEAASNGEPEEEEVTISAGKHGDATMESNADPTMAMARHKSDATDSTADATDESDATDVEAEAKAVDSVDPTSYSDADQGDNADPGDLNDDATANAKRNARSGGTNTKSGKPGRDLGIAASREKKRGTTVREISAAARVIRTLQAEKEELQHENKKLRNRVGAIEASLERYAERVERKSITPELQHMLEKSGYDVRELMSSRQKLSVSDVDTILTNSGVNLEPSMKMAIKNQFLERGLMETGEVRRYN